MRIARSAPAAIAATIARSRRRRVQKGTGGRSIPRWWQADGPRERRDSVRRIARDRPHLRAFTLGHSTRTLDELLGVLADRRIGTLVDVRTVPRSRRHPHFAGEALALSLPAAGVAYVHAPALGGFRRPRRDSPNGGWEHPAFRGYADHMASEEFAVALAALEDRARGRATCVMCAEAQWWRCHRRLIADALTVRRWEVLHLGLSGAEPPRHELTPFAVVDGTRITYPAPQAALEV